MTRRIIKALAAVGMGLLVSSAFADSISPATFSATLGVGESVTLTKTVTISAGKPGPALVDVKFIADTTGSMGGIIDDVKTNASTIMTKLSGFGDTQFGVSEYKDLSDISYGSYATKVNQVLTSSTAAVQAGINQWSADGGGDWAEANLIALKQQAEATDWRAGSNRFIVQFGDAAGHENGLYPSLTDTITALKDNHVKVLVVGTSDMNRSDWCSGDCTLNAATTIADSTGGSFNNLVDPVTGLPADIAKLIEDAIGTAFSTYKSVTLGVIGGAIPGVEVAIAPVSYTGSWDRSVDRTFTFDVTFKGMLAGLHSFDIGAFVDGGLVAKESDRITVGSVSAVPLPGALPMLLGAFGIGGSMLRRRRQQA